MLRSLNAQTENRTYRRYQMFNREIAAYSLGRRANSGMVAQMLDQAFGRLKGETPLLHSD